MGISGSLETIGLPDVLQLLSSGHKTGTLILTRSSEICSIFFQEGAIIYAQSTARQDAVLNYLVRQSAISPEHAEKIKREAKHERVKTDQIIARDAQVPDEVTLKAVMEQSKEIVYDIFQWLEGEFLFKEGELPEGESLAITASIGTYNLIMEGSRRIDEWTRIRKAIPSMETVFRLEGNPESGDIQFEKSEWKILAMIDGRRTVREISQASKLSEFEVFRILYGLKSAGLIQPTMERASARPPSKSKSSSPIILTSIISSGVIVAAIIIGLFFGGGKETTIPAVIENPQTPIETSIAAEERTSEIIQDEPTSLPVESKPDSERENIASAISEPTIAETIITEPTITEPTVAEPVITEPEITEPADSPDSEKIDSNSTDRLDINTASAEQLTTLPRIGPVTAEKIIAYRDQNGPFQSTADITNVPGIGTKTYERFKDMITTGKGTGNTSSRISRQPSETKTTAASEPGQTGSRVNINTASAEDLTSLPRIGPSLAKRIIEYRRVNGEFAEPHDITNVPGIGEKTYLNFEDKITVR